MNKNFFEIKINGIDLIKSVPKRKKYVFCEKTFKFLFGLIKKHKSAFVCTYFDNVEKFYKSYFYITNMDKSYVESDIRNKKLKYDNTDRCVYTWPYIILKINNGVGLEIKLEDDFYIRQVISKLKNSINSSINIYDIDGVVKVTEIN